MTTTISRKGTIAMIELNSIFVFIPIGATEGTETLDSFVKANEKQVRIIDPALRQIRSDGRKFLPTMVKSGITIQGGTVAELLEGRTVLSSLSQAVICLAENQCRMPVDNSPNFIPFRTAEDERIVIRVHRWWCNAEAVLSLYRQPLDSKTVFEAGVQLFIPSQ